MDFYRISERVTKNGGIQVYPDFKVGRSKDLMVRGKSFYSVWDQESDLWSTDEYDIQRLIDRELQLYADELKKKTDARVTAQYMGSFSSKGWREYRNFVGLAPDSSHQLDNRLCFANTVVKKNNYVSKRLPYPLEAGDYSAFDELIGTLYDPDERLKLEWAIGSVVEGESKDIQKFCVLYGEAGAGKSTVLNIIQKLFDGYYTVFEAKALTSSNNAFSTEAFRSNPLVAIQHDGDLSRIEDNTKLNSIISHEEIIINEKYKPGYSARVNCFLFMGTNKPVKITDAKSGIIRRLIDVKPSGRRLVEDRYHILMAQIEMELGAIAEHCLEVYREKGKQYYSGYRPTEMILKTDVFFNYVEECYDIFKDQDGVSLTQAYTLYKEYCNDALVEFKLPLYKFREELKNYFEHFNERLQVGGERKRNYYSGFTYGKFYSTSSTSGESSAIPFNFEDSVSLIDDILADCPAQYATVNETPEKRWDNVKTTLSDLDTTRVHYVRPPENHIVIDFDLKGSDGEKSIEENLAAAGKWPVTYGEFSKSGAGVHLHYTYNGDVSKLSRVFSEGIEIKVFNGGSSLRRQVSKCNHVPVATLSSGLPLKEVKVINFDAVKSEKSLRDLVSRNLRKEVHPGTKPSVDFIKKILDDAYASGLTYDLTDMRNKVLSFANGSTHQAAACLKLVGTMKFASEENSPDKGLYDSDELVFFDVETFPNLFHISWKIKGSEHKCVHMVNPHPDDVERLMRMKLVGYNCRQYDNHMLYAAFMGYNNAQLYALSQRIINGSDRRAGKFGEAYGISYTDVYDYLSKKQTLKKWQIELGIHHQELGLPWDEPVPEELWPSVGEYCDNDVISLEALFDARKEDFTARQILADLSGLSVNESTQQHTAKIIFGDERKPQADFVYTDLSTIFPGYKYEFGKSSYRGEDPSEGGYVHAKPGMYSDVALLDVASLHPTSIELLNCFGPYTKYYTELKAARLAIKHGDYESARKMLGGKLAPYLTDEATSEDLSYALKIVINIVYGLTSAKFPNAFKDDRNVDNIVAKRGALFMIDLKFAVEEQGFVVAHIKTDSIKIPNATPEIIEFVMEFGKKYGYDFEHEATYKKMCLVNDAVYIAYVGEGKHAGTWEATGAQFAQPYVFKTLFSLEPITFNDTCETKTVTTGLYLDMDENLPEGEHDYKFVGRAGQFTPVAPGRGGGTLLRIKGDKYYAASGTKGYRWLESEMVKTLGLEEERDLRYYDSLVDAAVDTIAKFGDFEWFIAD